MKNVNRILKAVINSSTHETQGTLEGCPQQELKT